MLSLAVLLAIPAGTVQGAGSPAATPDSCVGNVCGDLRPVLNPPFPTPTGMFFPEVQMRAAQAPAPQQRQAQVQLASMTVAGAGRMPMMRPGFVPVQQRGPAPAQAQAPARPAPASDARPPEPDRRGIDSWFAECPQGQSTGCRVLRRAPGADGSPGVTVIVAADPRSPGRNQATVVLPLGISVRESIPMLLDDRFVALLPIETCLPAGCVLTVALSPPMIAALRTTTTLKLLAPTPNGQTVPFVVPVSGFGDAYQKVAG
jgi:invasion protein IalB